MSNQNHEMRQIKARERNETKNARFVRGIAERRAKALAVAALEAAGERAAAGERGRRRPGGSTPCRARGGEEEASGAAGVCVVLGGRNGCARGERGRECGYISPVCWVLGLFEGLGSSAVDCTRYIIDYAILHHIVIVSDNDSVATISDPNFFDGFGETFCCPWSSWSQLTSSKTLNFFQFWF